MPPRRTKAPTTKGGEFVGQGAYGCTFYPAVQCQDTSAISTDDIGKVFGDKDSAEEELQNVSILKRIDPNQNFFLYPKRKCTVDTKRALSEDTRKKCNGISSAILHGQKTLDQLMLSHGGKDLFTFVHSTYPQKSMSRLQAVRLCYRAFEAVRLLVQSGWVHQDIKPDNIVHGPKGTRVIDFGSLMPAPQFYCVTPDAECPIPNYMIERNHEYPYSGPENRIVHENKSISSTHFRNSEMMILMKAVEFETLQSIVDPQKFKDSIKSFVKLMNNKSVSERVKTLRAVRAAEKADVYSMGIVLLQLGMLLKPANTEPEAAQKYRHLVTSCLLANPSERFSASQALDFMDSMLRPKKSAITKTNRVVPLMRSMSPLTPRQTNKHVANAQEALAGRRIVVPAPLFSPRTQRQTQLVRLTPSAMQTKVAPQTRVAPQIASLMQVKSRPTTPAQSRPTSVRSHPLKSNP